MQRQGEKGTVGGHVGPPGASGGKFTPTTLLGWCPSIYVINRVRIREQLLYLIQFIQECRWDTIAQQLSRRLDSIRHARSHGWRDGLPVARCPATARRFRRREALAQALMRQAKMIVCQRQPQVFLQPRQCFAAGAGFARQAPMVFAPVQIIPLDNAGIDSRAGSGSRKQCLDLLGLTKDDLVCHLNHPSFFAALDPLGIQQVGQWNPPGRWMTSSGPLACWLRPLAIRSEERLLVGWQWVAGEEGHVRLSHSDHALEEPMGILLRTLPHDTSHSQPPRRGKSHPHPGIAIPLAQ